MNDTTQPYDIEHTASTHGISIVSDVDYSEETRQWSFKGVNYKKAESKARDYIVFKEDGFPGLRLRQVRKRSSN